MPPAKTDAAGGPRTRGGRRFDGRRLARRAAGPRPGRFAGGSSAAPAVDSLAADSLSRRPIRSPPPDQGIHDVRIYRTDFQVVCDSMTGHQHRFDHPPLHRSRAVEPEQPDDLRRDGHLHARQPAGACRIRRQPDDKAAQLDSVHYNQIAGKQMARLFPRQRDLPRGCQRQRADDLLHAGRRTAADPR